MTRTVDLRLAVNYLPACACLGKMLLFMLAVSSIRPGEEVDSYVTLAAMLYLDRLMVRNMIFDANAIILAVYFSDVQAQLRAVSPNTAYPGVVDAMFLVWAMTSVVLIAEPHAVKQALERRPRANKLVPVVLMLLVVPAVCHFNAPLETGSTRACRAMAFTLMSFAWIYIVGIHTPRGIEHLKENSCQFVARLSPVLYVSPWIAVAFAFAATAALGIQYLRLVGIASPHTDKPQHATHTTPPPLTNTDLHATGAMDITVPTPSIAIMIADDAQQTQKSGVTSAGGGGGDSDSESTEALFRLACMQNSASNKRASSTRFANSSSMLLEPIWENAVPGFGGAPA